MTTEGRPSAQTSEARLLVVEDDANIVELLSASLRYAGFESRPPPTGTTALRQARDFRPDLLTEVVTWPGRRQ